MSQHNAKAMKKIKQSTVNSKREIERENLQLNNQKTLCSHLGLDSNSFHISW